MCVGCSWIRFKVASKLYCLFVHFNGKIHYFVTRGTTKYDFAYVNNPINISYNICVFGIIWAGLWLYMHAIDDCDK